MLSPPDSESVWMAVSLLRDENNGKEGDEGIKAGRARMKAATMKDESVAASIE
jgi:hypothetical protein